jgi:hypothetical protein
VGQGSVNARWYSEQGFIGICLLLTTTLFVPQLPSPLLCASLRLPYWSHPQSAGDTRWCPSKVLVLPVSSALTPLFLLTHQISQHGSAKGIRGVPLAQPVAEVTCNLAEACC